jgi:hypothetical protein
MSAAFVPLVTGALPSCTPSMPTRLKPISATPKTFEVADPARLQKTDAAPPAAAPHIAHGPPKITLERQGDLVTHIRIECSCGQITELKCEY